MGPFMGEKILKEPIHNTKVLDEVAKMAFRSEKINDNIKPIERVLLGKHYFRKHGKNT
jgi:L-ribulose-5-phosphate 4-epimerase